MTKVEEIIKKTLDEARKMYLQSAIHWIADEDNPGENQPVDELESTLTVVLVADLFEVTPTEVATAVWNKRNTEAGCTCKHGH